MNPTAQGYLDAYMNKEAEAGWSDALGKTIRENPYAGAAASGLGGAALGGAVGAMVGGKGWAIPAAIFGGLVMALADMADFGIDEAADWLMGFFEDKEKKNTIEDLGPEIVSAGEQIAEMNEAAAMEAAAPFIVSNETKDSLPPAVSDEEATSLVEGGPNVTHPDIQAQAMAAAPNQTPEGPPIDQSSLDEINSADQDPGYRLQSSNSGGPKTSPGAGQAPSNIRSSMELTDIEDADMRSGDPDYVAKAREAAAAKVAKASAAADAARRNATVNSQAARNLRAEQATQNQSKVDVDVSEDKPSILNRATTFVNNVKGAKKGLQTNVIDAVRGAVGAVTTAGKTVANTVQGKADLKHRALGGTVDVVADAAEGAANKANNYFNPGSTTPTTPAPTTPATTTPPKATKPKKQSISETTDPALSEDW